MSSDDILLTLEDRKTLGKGLTKLRSKGKVPVVIHNHGQDSIHAQADYKELQTVFDLAGKHHPVDVKIGKTDHLTLIKDVDFEPVKQQMRHVVFQAIRRGEAVEAEIPIVFKKDVEIPAERNSLLVLRSLDTVQVKAKPKDLPDELVVDPSKLAEIGDTLTVGDLEVPEGVELLTEPEHGIASVEEPKDQIAAADAAAADLAADAEGEGEEPEAIGEDTEEDAEDGEESPEASDKEAPADKPEKPE